MEALFASGRIIEIILGLVLFEAVALLAWRARTGRGPRARPLLLNLTSGASLMLALRASLVGAGWTVIAGWLALSFAAHLGELVLRFRERRHDAVWPHPTIS
ncbi:hypothetical protein [Methylobacterium planeticum]|uniref:Uncharacterized protein n=1 Tax=Methylobacterium planeticum TaxID=2615211 RepID=A0A6N6MXJ8_9HYPH|nr:hypothetical protein [Methylobacterium planeticum]KAB1074794.1 hypothetical protein F6X51_06650 [Methylobacterium planeticum]